MAYTNNIIKRVLFTGALLLNIATGLFAQAPSGTRVYWNLSLGDVILLPDKSIGWQWKNNRWEYTTSGGSSSSDLQYILMDPNRQFNGNPDALPHASKPVTKPSGGTVEIVNQSSANVATVLNNWKSRATAQGHPSSGYRIVISCNSKYTVLIDNVWSTYQDHSPDRMTGGLSFFPQSNGATLDLYIKGDNRFGNIFYTSKWIDISTAFKDKDGNTIGYTRDGGAPADPDFTTAQCVFHSATSAGSKSGTLVVGNITPGLKDGPLYFGQQTTYNFYCSVIGGSDNENFQDSRGIKITGGTIFAGAEADDVCSAIGGGGNGYGLVTITGGSVTAVTSSTGTAIGGGIGWTDYGGQASVTISGGEVYAYNHGIVRDYSGSKRFVPAAAIGGGSSFEKKCHETTVRITGGTIYAQSVGGVAIGGGGSAMGDGGDAVITISGSANVKAKSISGSQNGVSIPYGSSIGGGVGGVGGQGFGNGDGGNCTFTMTGGTLRAGSIGGGSTNSTNGGKVGFANARISGASTDIQGQFIMSKGSSSHCEFNMSAGKLHDSSINDSDYKLVKQDGGALWMDDPNGVVNITGGSILACKANNGGAVYTNGGTITVSNATIKNCQALTGNGGAFAVMSTAATVTLSNASITNNIAKNNGGAFFLNNNATVSITNGTIDDNKSTNQDGGAFYGSDGSSIALNSGSIERNSARNGGGIYLAKGAHFTYTTGASPSYLRKNHASSMGGGVYLARGETANKTKLDFVLNSTTLGFYDNIADVEADDIYSYGESTSFINFPNVNAMNLGGYSLPGTTLEWWEDYRTGDTRYGAGTQQGDASNIERYRVARDADHPIYKVPASSAYYEKYLCLTLGFEYGRIEIRRSGLEPRESAIYEVTLGDGTTRQKQYVVVYGTEDSAKTVIDGVKWNTAALNYMPKGTYTVKETSWTWYNQDKTTSATTKTQDISTDTGKIFKFSNTHIPLGTTPLHDEESIDNVLKQ